MENNQLDNVLMTRQSFEEALYFPILVLYWSPSITFLVNLPYFSLRNAEVHFTFFFFFLMATTITLMFVGHVILPFTPLRGRVYFSFSPLLSLEWSAHLPWSITYGGSDVMCCLRPRPQLPFCPLGTVPWDQPPSCEEAQSQSFRSQANPPRQRPAISDLPLTESRKD